ncbi:MAG: SRPBCC domain-containing protein [Xanthobacteraceae bacterium]
MQTSAASASAKSWPAPKGEVLGGGAVRVSVLVPGTPADAWRALTERDSVARWFGDLSETLRPGGTHRLDFGDGDFFAISKVRLGPPHSIAYDWRFLGTSPTDAIAWSIAAEDGACRVTVTDTEPSRTPSGCDEMIEGWTDFLQRLQGHRVTGRNTRYAWRKEFSGSIELALEPAAAFAQLLSSEGQGRWLPWTGGAIASGATLLMTDGGAPERLHVSGVQKESASLHFKLSAPRWRVATDCRIALQPWPSGALLVVTHDGWPAIDPLPTEQAVQRTRFGTLWTKALHDAKALVAG